MLVCVFLWLFIIRTMWALYRWSGTQIGHPRGMNAYQLQQLMGHEKITTTQEHVHLGEMDLRLIMEQTSL